MNIRKQEDRVITALFHERADAERAYNALRDHGFSEDEISVAISKETRERFLSSGHEETELGNKATEGAGVGGAVGGTAGGLIGALSAAAAPVVFPGIGLVLSGPLAAALAGAGAGGLGGSIIGGLIGAGIPEERVEHYERGLKEGGILIGVHPHNEEEARYANEVFRKYEGEHVHG